jgi:hypothetical protein
MLPNNTNFTLSCQEKNSLLHFFYSRNGSRQNAIGKTQKSQKEEEEVTYLDN